MFSVRGELRDAPWVWQKKVASIEVLGKPPWLKSGYAGWESRDLKQRSISAPVCGEACWIFPEARARRGSSPRAHSRARHRAPNRYGRRAVRSPRLSDCSGLLAACALLARDASSSWAYSSPFDCCFILPLVESHRFRIHWGPNRKIQYTESKKRGPPAREKNSRSASLEEGLKNALPPTKSTVGGNCAGPGANSL